MKEGLCEIIIIVVSLYSLTILLIIFSSVLISKALVASSKTNIGRFW